MNTKRKAILCHKLVCLSQLLIENLDELNPTTEIAIQYKESLIKFVEQLNNDIADTDTIQNKTYFNDIYSDRVKIFKKDYAHVEITRRDDINGIYCISLP